MTQKLIPALTIIFLDSPRSGFSSDSFSDGAEDGTADDRIPMRDNKASKWSTKSKDENET